MRGEPVNLEEIVSYYAAVDEAAANTCDAVDIY